MSQEPKANHLASEVSCYLLQHAHNPVDWYPWGEEAFNKAKELDRPILLSIGYATCHWCHVMERESFENEELAKLMNETFVNVKVDREELPHVDALYMDFAQAILGGAGGWPLNLVLTPDLKPFFAATYLPPDAAPGQLGMRQLALRIRELWEGEEKERVLEQADRILETFGETLETFDEQEFPTAELLSGISEILYRVFDPQYGGLQGAPKFPMGYQLNFLMRRARYQSEERALFLATKTLDMMYRGGIYDHIGGGFARYSVDTEWLIPHFEKMLYDNALLVLSYLEGWQTTQNGLYKAVCDDICSYLLSEMQGEHGGFFSAEDADSEGEEGRFYTWAFDELLDILGQREGELFSEFYGASPMGNFEGRNVLYLPMTLEEFAREARLDPIELAEHLSRDRLKLKEVTAKRVRPAKDDKILTCWNGLCIRALAESGFYFGNQRYIESAEKAALFIKTHLWKEGRLLRRWRQGEGGVNACLEDYAFLISGLLSLFKATKDSKHLGWAIQLSSVVSQDFRGEDGGFYRTDGRDPHLLLRQPELYDGAEPSGNAVHLENLLRLDQITGRESYLEEATQLIEISKNLLEGHPLGGAYHCLALERVIDEKRATVFVAFNEQGDLVQEITAVLANLHAPHLEVVWKGADDELIEQLIPSAHDKVPQGDKTTLYLCRPGVCQEPLTDRKAILETLENL